MHSLSHWQVVVEQLRAGRYVAIVQNKRKRGVKPVVPKLNVVWSLSEFWKRSN